MQDLLASDSPLSPLELKASGESLPSDTSLPALDAYQSPKQALQKVSLSSIPEVQQPASPPYLMRGVNSVLAIKMILDELPCSF